MSVSKIVAAAASGVGGAGLDVDEVFSTFVYNGNGGTQTITNGLDLSTEGGLVWIKQRGSGSNHRLFDTNRGVSKSLFTNLTDTPYTSSGYGVTAFNSNGFTLTDLSGGNYEVNGNISTDAGRYYTSWSFRKAPKFFDVVTYTGTGSAQNISHNLGTTVGAIFVKCTTDTFPWTVFYNSLGATKVIILNSTAASYTDSAPWNNTAPTDTVFTVGTDSGTNSVGQTYVAYIFAHNNNDGGFGPDGDADIIKCGSYTGTGSSGNSITLGFEPQWLMIKNISGSAPWLMFDVMRGMPTGAQARRLVADADAAESNNTEVTVTPTGFIPTGSGSYTNGSSNNYIYMAIRRGPLAAPDDATKVFAIDTRGASEPSYDSGFPVDLGIIKEANSTGDWFVGSRLIQGKYLQTNTTSAEASASSYVFDYMDGWNSTTGSNSNLYSWMWKRAPSYFDVCCYIGNDTAGRTVSHNLGAVPEMMWVKRRNSTGGDWEVYHKDIGNTKYLLLNSTAAASTNQYRWNNTTPTASVFTIGTATNVNANGDSFIAYLFATVEGVSKVGSYTGDGTTDGSKVIDCGFSSGARFVIIKNTTGGDWDVYDTVRGIVVGNDPLLSLNNNAAEATTYDNLVPNSSGFAVIQNTDGAYVTNTSGNLYIFYAIA